MPVSNSASFMFGPIVALIAIGALVLILRWAFRRGVSLVPGRPKPGKADDYGLLVPVASPGTYVEGEILRRDLERAGIRANLAQTLDGPRVLVWPQDQQRAREHLARRG